MSFLFCQSPGFFSRLNILWNTCHSFSLTTRFFLLPKPCNMLLYMVNVFCKGQSQLYIAEMPILKVAGNTWNVVSSWCPFSTGPYREAQKHLTAVVLLITSAGIKKFHAPGCFSIMLLSKPKHSFSSASSKCIKIPFSIHFYYLALPFALICILKWIIILLVFS